MMGDLFDKLAAVSPWINDRLAFVVRHGSMAYGTNVEGSDKDFKGICVASKEYYLGFMKGFEQQELKEPDACIYEIRKFFKLASACNPNVIEVLHTDPEDHILVNPVGQKIIDARDKFLSKRVRFSFGGYARSQLNRIELHRRYLLNPPSHKPERAEFSLPPKPELPEEQMMAAKAEIAKELEKYNFGSLDLLEYQTIAVQNTFYDILAELKITRDDEWMSAARKIGLADNFIFYMQRERQYEGKKREWDQYNDWKRNRNEKRAADEAKYGYDCKHAYHLIRLLRMAKEILETGKVIVKRPDREELLAIRNGAWGYEKLVEYANELDGKLDEICAKSIVPAKPDIKFLDRLCVEIVKEML